MDPNVGLEGKDPKHKFHKVNIIKKAKLNFNKLGTHKDDQLTK